MQSKKPELRFKEFSDEWDKKRLSDLLFEHKEKNFQGEFDRNDVLSVSRNHGIVNQIEHLGRSYAGVSILNYHIVRTNDIVYTKSPLALNPYGIIKANKNKEGIVSTLYAVYRCKKDVNSDFIDFYFSLDDHLNKYLRPLVQKGAKNDMKINNQRVLIDPIYIPKTEKEQEKISSFLTSIDNKIEQLTNAEMLLQQYKKGVMQKIFNQEIRFKKDDGNSFPQWQDFKLGKFLVPTLREILKPQYKYLAIGIKSHCKGTFQKPNSDPDKIAMDKLYLVKENDLIVNITFAWEGAIAIVKKEDENGLVSHRFPTYTFKETITNSHFFQYIIIQKKFRYMLDLISPGGAGRNRVMSKKDFLQLKWKLPCIEEQTKIANFLSSIDSKIEKVQNQLKQTKEFKKGLLQRMFV